MARTPFALAMRFLPWVALAVGGALLAIAVLSTDSGEPIFEGDEFERAQVTPGDCLNVGDDTYSVVSCDVANSGVFVRQIGPNGLCPTEAPLSYRLSRLTLCLRPNQFTELPGE